MTLLREARTPSDTRIYAIGDVHGQLAKLRDVHARIEADLAARPAADHYIVHVGDYVDRGPDSAGVIDHLIDFTAADPRRVALLGNHDLGLLGFVFDDPDRWDYWLHYGADTCRSYGVELAGARDEAELRERLSEQVPPAHLAFLAREAFHLTLGDYLFVHAGVRPGVPLDRQRVQDLVWIREGFLDHPGDFGPVVVHGHTPTSEVEFHSNRIGIDTGAGFGGPIACLVLEDDEKGLLGDRGYERASELY